MIMHVFLRLSALEAIADAEEKRRHRSRFYAER
jgi:hypothetical protein